MNRLTVVILVIASVSFETASALGMESRADSITQTTHRSADSDWIRLFPSAGEVSNGEDALRQFGAGSVNYWRWSEKSRRRWFDEGLQFWQNHPRDLRKWDWLRLAMLEPPRFWADIEQGAEAFAKNMPQLAKVDNIALEKWRTKRIELRTAIMYDAPDAIRISYWEMLYNELRSKISELGPESDISQWARLTEEVIDYCASIPEEHVELSRNVAMTIYNRIISSGPRQVQQAFCSSLRLLPNSRFAILASGFEQFATLRQNPFGERLTTMEGNVIDPSTLRGKVWVLDGWNTRCSSCIDVIKELRLLYDKYRALGFEIVGVCFDDEQDRPRIDKVIAGTGASWPQSMQGRLKDSAFAARYGIVFNPVTWLFDRDGVLVANDLKGLRLENEVRRLLGLPLINSIEIVSPGGGSVERNY